MGNQQDEPALPPPPACGYPNKMALEEFRGARAAGRVSWFRVETCKVCKKPMPKGYEWCSIACHRKAVTPADQIGTEDPDTK